MTSVDFLLLGGSYSLQHKEGPYDYRKNTDGVTLFLKAHHVDQIMLVSAYMRHLFDVEFKKKTMSISST